MKRKYLDDVGIIERHDNNWNNKRRKDNRESFWKKQRETYSFDERETWNLNDAFFMWLYERLSMYIDIGGEVVDYNFHKFYYKKKRYTQLQIMNIILEDIRFYFNAEGKYYNDKTDDYCVYQREKYNKEIEIGKLWSKILPAMWW